MPINWDFILGVNIEVQDLGKLVVAAQSGNAEAYNQIVHHFQDLAVAYGYSILGDFQLAEDAAQEAFIEAFCCLASLQEPHAFAGWLRRIVFKHCDRIIRKKQASTAPLSDAFGKADPQSNPQQIVEKQEASREVQEAISLLPGRERSVIVLFYFGQHSQNEISTFLGVPLTTVKKRLYTARQKLKEKMIKMNAVDLEHQRPSRNPQFAESVRLFTLQFSKRIDAGQSIVKSLAVIAEQEQDEDLRRIIAEVQQDVTGDGHTGTTLSGAMSKHPQMFNESYVATIKHAEIAGNLKDVLEELGAD